MELGWWLCRQEHCTQEPCKKKRQEQLMACKGLEWQLCKPELVLCRQGHCKLGQQATCKELG